MKQFELLQRLNKMGAVFVRHGGNHDVYINPRRTKKQPFPVMTT
jgi:hypothetical protein